MKPHIKMMPRTEDAVCFMVSSPDRLSAHVVRISGIELTLSRKSPFRILAERRAAPEPPYQYG